MSPQLDRTNFETAGAALCRARQQVEQARLGLYLDRDWGKDVTNPEVELSKRKDAELDQIMRFAQYSDPRTGVRYLSDTTPTLLMPLRIETRFKIVTTDTEMRHQLWVRVYPDEAAIDTFEPDLSETEVANARAYWIDVWRAGGDEDRLRAAWRSLVGSHGSGRAFWIQEKYRPDNIGDQPKKQNPSDVLLVIPIDVPLRKEHQEIPAVTPLPENLRPPLEKYWIAIWRADGKQEKIVAAENALEEALSPMGLSPSDLIATYRPANLEELPPKGHTKTQAVVSVAYVAFPPTSSVKTRRSQWSQAAKVNIMPERLVLLGYCTDGAGTYQQVLEQPGELIPSPLIMSPDPSEPKERYLFDLALKYLDRAHEGIASPSGRISPGHGKPSTIPIVELGSTDQIRRFLDALRREFADHGIHLTENAKLEGVVDGEDERTLEIVDTPRRYLVVLENPNAIKPSQSKVYGLGLRIEDGDVVVNDDMAWMVDFESAIRAGMGFRVELTPEQYRRGFDRLLVLGLRLSANAVEGEDLIEELFQHHRQGRAGFSLVAQGTPTNNTEQAGAGYSRIDDADASYDDYFGQEADSVATNDWLTKKDGQWLAEFLGINPGILKGVHNAVGTDQREARSMSIALWPATLGYFMETMMHPVFTFRRESIWAVEKTHWFFTNFVSGRGMVPAIRIGRQPYGILPTTVFSRIGGSDGDQWDPCPAAKSPLMPLDFFAVFRIQDYLEHLQKLLYVVSSDAKSLRDSVPRVGEPGDPHQILLDVIGLHPGSVEYYQRYAQSFEQILTDLPSQLLQALLVIVLDGYRDKALQFYNMSLASRLPFATEFKSKVFEPDLLRTLLNPLAEKLKIPVVDDRPPSESASIRPYADNDWNYIEWLVETARSHSIERIRKESGFNENKPPTALLYIMLRHAILLGYLDAALRLNQTAKTMGPYQLDHARKEPRFVHIDTSDESQNSRWSYLYSTEPSITGSTDELLVNYIATLVAHADPGKDRALAHLLEQIAALDLLRSVPTARLERAFAEHIDCLTYRLDAWKLGLANYRLCCMRFPDGQPQKGTFLGMYGWLEDVRPENKELVRVGANELKGGLREIFARNQDLPLVWDSTNAGYVHAPSLNHAVTSAVLRSGYMANASQQNPYALAVNLSSERVRRTLSVLEGIRNGQSLGALLGYQLERMLHDNSGDAEVDELIYKIRRVFPLVADRFSTTKAKETDPIEAIEARNVVDGLALLDHITTAGKKDYDWGKDLPKITNEQKGVIYSAVQNLCDLRDAVADVAMAEGVHQAALGNYDRAAATLDAYSKATFPDLPDVVQTPRSGFSLAHRVAIHLDAKASVDASPIAGVDMTPRARVEPALNKWLASILPHPDRVICLVKYVDSEGKALTAEVSQTQLKLQPIDLLYMLDTESQQAMTALDDRVIDYAQSNLSPRLDTPVAICYTDRVDDKIPLFELSALVQSLRTLLLASRPLRLEDLTLQGEAYVDNDSKPAIDLNQLQNQRKELVKLRDKMNGFIEKKPVSTDEVIRRIDDNIKQYVDLARSANAYGIPQAGISFAYEWRRTTLVSLLGKLSAIKETKVAQVDGIWDADIDGLAAPLEAAHKIASASPLSNLRLPDIDVETEVKATLRFTQDLQARVKALALELTTRIENVDKQITTCMDSAESKVQIEAFEKGAKALFGDGFLVVPAFFLPQELMGEWENAVGQSVDLLEHELKNADFPVDDWLYGIARVREKMHDWEKVTLLAEAFGVSQLDLVPVQFPYRKSATWLALSYPENTLLQDNYLLYTAHFAVPFDRMVPLCGLLLDEWTEVVPTRQETTGVAFHYDCPSTEAPQVMLLVVPPSSDGWHWQDLVDSLHETLDLAKERAIEPRHIDATLYSQFLPTIMMADAATPLTIVAHLGANNQVNHG